MTTTQPPNLKALRRMVSDFLRDNPTVSKRQFGLAAASDGHFVKDLRGGRRVRPRLALQIAEYIHSNSAKAD